MTRLLMLGACLCLLGGCWGSTYPNWAECDGRLHLPRDSYSDKEPESVGPYLDACTKVLTDAGYKVVRDNTETIFASKGEELAPFQGKLPRTVQVKVHSASEALDISITAKTRKYPHGWEGEYNWTETHRDATTEMRQLVNQLMDLVDLRYPSPASK